LEGIHWGEHHIDLCLWLLQPEINLSKKAAGLLSGCHGGGQEGQILPSHSMGNKAFNYASPEIQLIIWWSPM